MHLDQDELSRYTRHFSLENVGESGQIKLKTARVACVGAGGLGHAVLMYLTAAGVGTIGIIDADVVDITNLQRQVLFDSHDIQNKKIVCAQKKLNQHNPHVNILMYDTYLKENNAISILQDFDIVLDCTDNFAARYVINEACFRLKKPNVYAGINQFKGQCSIFTTEKGPCYRCLYPMPSLDSPNCNAAGVFGVLPGILGLLQATEAMKLILQIGHPLIGRLLTFDALRMQFSEFNIQKDPNCVLCKDQLIGRNPMSTHTPVSEITVAELKTLLSQDQCFLVDVREPEEYLQQNIGGHLIPLKELPARCHELPQDKLIVVHCKSGKRSATAVEFLQANGFNTCKSLRGGILEFVAT